MTKRISLKTYKGQRIYVATSIPRIAKILVWDAKGGHYVNPKDGKPRYYVRKQAIVDGKKTTIARHLDTMQECLTFRSTENELQEKQSSKIGELIMAYKSSVVWERLQYTTQIMYSGLFERWFDLIANVPIRELTPQRVSLWILDMKEKKDRFLTSKTRQSFRKELDLLKSLLAWYGDYRDDPNFASPIKKRHSEEIWLDQKSHLSTEDFFGQVSDEIPLTESDYERFRAELAKAKLGATLTVLADTQFEHSLRISEVAALMWQDVKPGDPKWSEGEIKFQRHIQYVHRSKEKYPDRIALGLKNRKFVKRKGMRFLRRESLSKTNPFFPRSTSGLRQLYLKASPEELHATDEKGLVFKDPKTGSFFTYRCLKAQYDRALLRAGLPFRGTHIVRYAGVNAFLNPNPKFHQVAKPRVARLRTRVARFLFSLIF
ncbi:MAG: hypothetical protein AB7T49_03605 [Oligoflexales bacterium]